MALKKSRGPIRTVRYPNTAAAISAGDIVMLDSSGDALTAAAAASNRGVVGVAESDADASSEVIVQEGEFLCDATTVTGQEGVLCYAESGDSVDESQATNEPVCGVITEVVSASQCWVRMGAGVRRS